MKKSFQIDNIEYTLELDDKKELYFSRYDGVDMWGDYVDYTGLKKSTKNVVKVLRGVINEAILMALVNNISYFTFCSYDDKRSMIYEILVRKTIEKRNLPF